MINASVTNELALRAPTGEAKASPQRVRVLLNASSGTTSAERCGELCTKLEEAFAMHGISATLEVLPGEGLQAGAERAAQEASRAELDAIVVAGGDGSIRTVAGVLADSGVRLGVIPLGTRNHFAKDLGLPLALDKAVAVIAAGDATAVDVAEVNGRVFVNNSSIGVYPYLVLDRERRRRRSRLWKWVAMIPAMLRAIRNFPLRRLRITTGPSVEVYRSPCVFIGNNEYQLQGFDFGSRRGLSSGQLCLYVAKRQSVISLVWLGLRCVLGLLDHQRDLRAVILPALTISSHKRRLLVAMDGEIESIPSPLNYRTRPAALQVFSPSSRPD